MQEFQINWNQDLLFIYTLCLSNCILNFKNRHEVCTLFYEIFLKINFSTSFQHIPFWESFATYRKIWKYIVCHKFWIIIACHYQVLHVVRLEKKHQPRLRSMLYILRFYGNQKTLFTKLVLSFLFIYTFVSLTSKVKVLNSSRKFVSQESRC